ncbi:MAG: hypothetical protein AAF702_12705 [Chloroflexota bacterium]
MQSPSFVFVLLIMLIIGVTISIHSRKSTTPRKCQHCGSLKMEQISHETLNTKTVNLHENGFLPGADIRLEIEQDLTYRCQVCNRRTTFRITHTP